MKNKWQFFLCLLLAAVVLGGQGQYACLVCPDQLAEPSTCHGQTSRGETAALAKACCCATIHCAAPGQYPPTRYVLAADDLAQLALDTLPRFVVAAESPNPPSPLSLSGVPGVNCAPSVLPAPPFLPDLISF